MKLYLRLFSVIALLPVFLGSAAWSFGQATITDSPSTLSLMNQPLSEYQSRRRKLLDHYQDGAVVILGAVEEEEGTVRYRQNNWMAYFTGVSTPNAALLLIPQGLPSLQGAREILFIPPRDRSAERWTGVQMGPGPEAAKAFGVERVLPIGELIPRLKEAAGLAAFRVTGGATKMKLYTVAPGELDAATFREYQFVERATKEIPGLEVGRGEDSSFAHVAGELRKSKSPI
jgi:hypothetical protein